MNITSLSSASNAGFSLYAVVENDSCVVREFIQNLDDVGKSQVLSLFQRVAHHGIPHNETKFRELEDSICELKTRSGIRILCFFGGSLLPRSLILTHGFLKCKKKILDREIRKAVTLHEQYEREETKIVNI